MQKEKRLYGRQYLETQPLALQARKHSPTTANIEKIEGERKGERVRKRKSPLNRNFGTIFSLSPNKKAIHNMLFMQSQNENE